MMAGERERVNGPEECIVSEMMKQLPQENIDGMTRCFQNRSVEVEDAPSSWGIVKLVFLRKPDAEPKKRDKKLQGYRIDVSDSKWYATVLILRSERKKEPEGWKLLHVRGIDGISCQHLQVIVTQPL